MALPLQSNSISFNLIQYLSFNVFGCIRTYMSNGENVGQTYTTTIEWNNHRTTIPVVACPNTTNVNNDIVCNEDRNEFSMRYRFSLAKNKQTNKQIKFRVLRHLNNCVSSLFNVDLTHPMLLLLLSFYSSGPWDFMLKTKLFYLYASI